MTGDSFRHIVIALGIVLLATFLPAQGDAYLQLTDYGSSLIRVAVLDYNLRAESYGASWDSTIATLAQILRDDLDYSPFIEVVDTSLYPRRRVDFPKNIDPFEWTRQGIQVLVIGDFDTDGYEVSLKMVVWSTTGMSKMFKHDYKCDAVQARRLTHRISDDIHKILTGEEGVAQTQISFVSTRWSGKKELFVCDYDGYAPRRITNSNSIVLSPDWSPAGDKIAYMSFKNDNPDLYIYDVYKNRETLLAHHVGQSITPSWSPDGRYICYSRDFSGNSELFLVDTRTNEKTRLTYTPYSIESSPCFSPTGREIAFTSDRSGAPQIYIMDAMGANCRRLTFEGNYNDGADWSPRGDKICYTSRNNYGFDIAVIDFAAGTPIYLTSVGNNENPYWSPDGYHIVFSSSRTGRYQLYTMNWDGTDVRRITGLGKNSSPAWSPRYKWSFD